MNCDPSSLLQAAKCFRCLPKPELRASIIYALCQWANGLQCDEAALAFLQAIGVSEDSTEGQALCQLVNDLKAYPEASPEGDKYWDRDEIIYPLIGGTPETHSVNLKNPGTNDLTYPVAGLTHDANGITGNGTAYADTGYPLTGAQVNSARAMVYIDQKPTPGLHQAYFGAISTGGTPAYFYLTFRNAEAICRFGANGSSGIASPTLDALGANFIQRQNNAQIQVSNASDTWGNVANLVITNADRNIFLLGLNDGTPPPTSPSTARISGFSFGAPLTSDAELAEYRSIWDRFETALGRGH